MKKRILLLTIICCTLSCSINKKPEFLKVDNIQLINATADTLVISADAYFNNPNDISGTLETKGISVLVNTIKMTEVASPAFKVPANNIFSIPLTAKVATKDVLEKGKNGLLGNILNSLISKKISVQYTGDITYKALGISYNYPIDITQDISLE